MAFAIAGVVGEIGITVEIAVAEPLLVSCIRIVGKGLLHGLRLGRTEPSFACSIDGRSVQAKLLRHGVRLKY